MNREVHVRFWESPEVKVLRATRQAETTQHVCGGVSFPRKRPSWPLSPARCADVASCRGKAEDEIPRRQYYNWQRALRLCRLHQGSQERKRSPQYPATAEAILARAWPPPKGRIVQLGLPVGLGIDDGIAAAFDRIIAATGTITAAEALDYAALLEKQAAILRLTFSLVHF
jgi:hypothetical protein